MPDVLQSIREVSKKAGFSVLGLAVEDAETGEQWLLEENRYFHAASTIKVAVLLAVFRAAEQGCFKLEDALHIRNRFFSASDGAVFKVDNGRDADADVHKRIGRTMRIGDLARLMIVRSSNLATNLLLDYVGVDFANEQLRQLGLEGIRLKRGVEDEKAFEAGINNEVTASGLLELFKLLYSENGISEESRQRMLDILNAQEFSSMIPAKLPADAIVAHKTGEISTHCHDAGIVFVKNRQPYTIVILTEGPANLENRQKNIAEISSLIFEHLRGEKP